MQNIRYPNLSATAQTAFGQESLDRLTAQLFDWQQAAGAFGGLCLHACWGETSVLARRYQGQCVYYYLPLMAGGMDLYRYTGNPRWKRLCDDMASNLLFLQCPDGGFRHAANEFEPAYHSAQTCPIHQNAAVLTLLDYAAWTHADPTLQALIRPALDRHWAWFNDRFWRRGNGWQRPLAYDAGWCGVTNQDLVVVATLSAYGRLYGDWSRYEKWGKRALDVFLSPAYYHENVGLFERGDADNFVERTPYYRICIDMLERILADTGDSRLRDVIDRVALRLFDSVYTGPDGLSHMAWGAKTAKVDGKTIVTGWVKTPVVFGDYPALIDDMARALVRRPDPQKEKTLDALRRTLTAYTFWDGSIPAALWPKDPAISLVGSPSNYGIHWRWLIQRLGDAVADPAPCPPVCVRRKVGDITWKNAGALWVIERGGERAYGGYKPVTHGVTHGGESALFGDYAALDACDVLEELDENPGMTEGNSCGTA